MVILFKKVLRDIKRHKGQFAAIFLTTAIGLLIYAGIHAYVEGMRQGSARYYRQYNLPDMWIKGRTFSADDLERVRRTAGVKLAERAAVFDSEFYDQTGVKNTLRLNFIESNQLSQFYVVEGDGFEVDRDQIWLDAYLARQKHLKVGDTVSFKFLDTEQVKTIAGLILTPDRVYDVESDGQLFPSHQTYGFAYLSAQFFPSTAIHKLTEQRNPLAVFDMRQLSRQEVLEAMPFAQISLQLTNPSDFNTVKQRLLNTLANSGDQFTVKTPLLVTGRTELLSYRAFEDETNEGAAYVAIFAGIFLLIATLSVATTMNRLVINQRAEIGALKSLGFRDQTIVLIYISYGLTVGGLACLAGVFIGPLILSRHLFKLLTRTHAMPDLAPVIPMRVYGAAIAVLTVIILVSYLACRRQLLEPASSILRTKTPKLPRQAVGRWKTLERCSFVTKWNLRDVTRNKLRSLMGMSGAIGTSLLIVCAIGMLDSLNYYIAWQFDDLSNYRSRISMRQDVSDQQLSLINQRFKQHSSMTIPIEWQTDEQIITNTMLVDDSKGSLRHNDEQRQRLDLANDGLYLTHKLASRYQLQAGQTIRWRPIGEASWHTSRIAGLNRKPQDQNLTATRAYYERYGRYRPTHFYSNEAISRESVPGVQDIQDLHNTRQDFHKMLEMFHSLIYLIIVAAGILGVVVIYNIGSLAIIEKNYQFATLQVLGFRNQQISRIFKQQNYWLGIIGALLGLPLGYLTTNFIFQQALGQNYDFFAQIQPVTYLIGMAGTVVMLVIVNQILARKIRQIKMTESLKSAD